MSETSKVLTLKLTWETYETMGHDTLIGMAAGLTNPTISEADYIQILFPETSAEYRRKHNGPHMVILPEYALLAVASSVLWFQDQGLTVIESRYINDPD